MPSPDNQSAKIVRGRRLKLHPNAAQTAILDRWRRRIIELWNLLLGFEQAAYSGERYRTDTKWRAIWAEVVKERHARALDRYQNGWQRKDGSWRKQPGEGKEPKPPADDMMAKISGKVAEPKIFIWEDELNALMARLKAVPSTKWIGELPSHAAQRVVTELCEALRAMLREKKKKKTSGAGGRDTGFPRFKPKRYAAGSIYFANTQIGLAFHSNPRRNQANGGLRGEVRLPSEVGSITFAAPWHTPKDGKIMGARAWRRGEEWWLSVQFETESPKALVPTGKSAGVKIAASVLLTTFDGQRYAQIDTPAEDKRRVRRYKLAGRKLARRRLAQRTKEGKSAKRKGVAKLRLRRSRGFYAAAERLALMEAGKRDGHDLFQRTHANRIVKAYDAITLQKMDVASLLRKEEAQSRRQRRRAERGAARNATAPDTPKRSTRSFKVVRKINRRAAMARQRMLIEYKARDAGRVFNETHTLFPDVQACSKCGAVNPAMKDGRAIFRCPTCNHLQERRKNAAANEKMLGEKAREATQVLKDASPAGGSA